MDFETCLKTHAAPFDDLEKLANTFHMTEIEIVEEPSAFFKAYNYRIRCEFSEGSEWICVTSKMSVTDVLESLEKTSRKHYDKLLNLEALKMDTAWLSGSKSMKMRTIVPAGLTDTIFSKSIDKDIDILDVFTKLFAFSKTSWNIYYGPEKEFIVIESERGKFKFNIECFIDMLISLNIFKAME